MGIELRVVAEPDFDRSGSEAEFRGATSAKSFFSRRTSRSPGLRRTFGDMIRPSYR
jgi:hypothetical protein